MTAPAVAVARHPRVRAVALARRPGVRVIAWAVAAALVALGAAIIALELWRVDLRTPFWYRDDEVFYQALTKAVLEHGWHLENPSLGAPFVQRLADFPQGAEFVHLLLLKVIAAFAGDPVATMNLFFVLSFPLVAASAFGFFVSIGASRPASFVAAVLFAVLPYHFFRSTQHVVFVAYYGIPMAAFLAVATWRGRAFFGLQRPAESTSRRRRIAAQFVLPAALCLVIASTGLYFAFFAVLMLAFATFGALVRGLPRSVIASGAIVIALISGVVLAHLAPSLVQRAAEGINTDTPVRSAAETQFHSLQLADLVLPMDGHRIRALAELAELRQATARLGEAAPGLGVAAVVGLVAMAALFVQHRRGRSFRARRPVGALAALTAGAFLLGVTGGLSALIALLVTPQFRSWSRIELFIALFALGVLAFLLDEVGAHLRTRFPARAARVAHAALLAAVLAVGVVDQTSPALVPPYQTAAARFRSDAAFFQTLEATLPAGSAVLQLPLIPFPEWPSPATEGGYGQLKPYLHSSQLRWSYGLVKGREAGWQAYLTPRAVHPSLTLALAADYAGILVARRLYDDGGREVERHLSRQGARLSVTSDDGAWSFWDLEPAAPRLLAPFEPDVVAANRALALEPVRLRWLHGFDPMTGDTLRRSRDVAPEATFLITNPGAEPRQVRFQAWLHPFDKPAVATTLAWPDGTHHTIAIGRRGRLVDRVVTVPPGGAEVSLTSHVADPTMGPFGRRALTMLDAWAMDESLFHLAEGRPTLGPPKPAVGA